MPEILMTDWPQYSPDDMNRRENTVAAVKLMANAAQTAPVGGGIPQVETHIVYGQKEQEKIARKMEDLAWEVDNGHMGRMFKYEAVMVREADAVLFIGNTRAHTTPADADCGACGGVDNCSFFYERRPHVDGLVDPTKHKHDTLVDGPLCTMHVQDSGFGIGSALFMANKLMVDARPFMTVGVAGQKLGFCPNCALVVGVLVAATQKNPFVDITPDYHVTNIPKMIDSIRRTYILNRQGGGDYRLTDPGWDAEKARLKEEKKEE
jgi:uncharacterized ferredoxin-like protein